MDGIGWAASAMDAAKSRLDIAASNLANASSDGFRKHLARGIFSPRGAHVESVTSDGQGALRHTGRPCDFGLAGPGAFSVRDRGGAIHQTRNGAFEPDRHGILRDPSGNELVGATGAVHMSEGASAESDGTIRLGGRVVARIPLPAGTTLHTGFLEASNVNSISEMIDVLAAQRSFESAQKVVTAIDSTQQKASNELARLK